MSIPSEVVNRMIQLSGHIGGAHAEVTLKGGAGSAGSVNLIPAIQSIPSGGGVVYPQSFTLTYDNQTVFNSLLSYNGTFTTSTVFSNANWTISDNSGVTIATYQYPDLAYIRLGQWSCHNGRYVYLFMELTNLASNRVLPFVNLPIGTMNTTNLLNALNASGYKLNYFLVFAKSALTLTNQGLTTLNQSNVEEFIQFQATAIIGTNTDFTPAFNGYTGHPAYPAATFVYTQTNPTRGLTISGMDGGNPNEAWEGEYVLQSISNSMSVGGSGVSFAGGQGYGMVGKWKKGNRYAYLFIGMPYIYNHSVFAQGAMSIKAFLDTLYTTGAGDTYISPVFFFSEMDITDMSIASIPSFQYGYNGGMYLNGDFSVTVTMQDVIQQMGWNNSYYGGGNPVYIDPVMAGDNISVSFGVNVTGAPMTDISGEYEYIEKDYVTRGYGVYAAWLNSVRGTLLFLVYGTRPSAGYTIFPHSSSNHSVSPDTESVRILSNASTVMAQPLSDWQNYTGYSVWPDSGYSGLSSSLIGDSGQSWEIMDYPNFVKFVHEIGISL